MNFETARNSMIENQLRPNKIADLRIINIFNEVAKEEFLRDELKKIAYSDDDIELTSNRGYLKNLHIAQLIQFSNIKPDDKVLHIGGLTGYVTSLLCKLSNNVIVIENDEQLMIELKNNLKKNNLVNVETINRDLELGYVEKSPYDIILIDCHLNESFLIKYFLF